jgi:hypothetical protein
MRLAGLLLLTISTESMPPTFSTLFRITGLRNGPYLLSNLFLARWQWFL